ncbi:MAG: CoA pyrophosphatase [Desulfuromonadales bacterium]|nr:CoA pyrophosphatase [Desulfuromonadales bacterium]
MPETPQLDRIIKTLAGHQPQHGSAPDKRHASVALILRDGELGPEVLFIRRAEHEDDPWSGDVAFPGGRVEQHDEDPRQAAERETREEIDLDLAQADYLGQIDDIQGAYLPVRISCFVYFLATTPQLNPNYEVVDTFWVPLKSLQDPVRNREELFVYRSEARSHPIIDLGGYSERFLWGITYRLIQQFFTLVEAD